ncbi:MAG: aminopeptidase N [Colwellia sp.]
MSHSTPRFLADYKTAEFTINTVNLTITLDDHQSEVCNEMSVVRQGEHQQSLVLNGEHLTLISVHIDGQKLLPEQYQLSATQLCIPTDKSHFNLTVVTQINPIENTALEGLFKSGDAFCTQCEAEGFRRISYYLDRPDVMATFTTKVIADKHLYPYLLSNGNKVAEGDLPNDHHFVTWHDPFPKPCYLFALVAGDFDLLTDNFTTCSGRDVALEIFVDKGNLAKAKHAMVSLQKSMLWDEQTFGLEYDLDIYMIVAVDFFNMGAMENKGLNVFNSKYVLADNDSATDNDYFNIEAVIAHEYFHNWTGNRVTCRDWFQLSLKEGLTVFRDQQFSADMHSSAVTRIQNVTVLRSHQFAEDAGPMAHPIRPEKVLEMNNFYTLTVYEKGAEVIRMLHTLLGKDGFRQGMDLYFKRFDGMAVTCDDFIAAMADATDKDLTQFKRWYSQSGTPVVSVLESFNVENGELTITLKQQVAKQSKALHIPIKIELLGLNETMQNSHLLELTAEKQQWVFKGLSDKPTVAYLADFSAPIKLNEEKQDEQHSNQALMTIANHANNSFCRWDAGQKLSMFYLTKLTLDVNYVLPAELAEFYNHLLPLDDTPLDKTPLEKNRADQDNAFIAEQLKLPSFDEAAALIEHVDPIALVNAIETLTLFIAKATEKKLLNCYLSLNVTMVDNEQQATANRALKNVCLNYLTALPQHTYLVEQQFEGAENMTDSLAALVCSAKYNLSTFTKQMQHFEDKWSDTPLVMDKWFTIQASLLCDNIFENLAELLTHPLFSLNNPNRARSLIGAFAMINKRYFHCNSGKGYLFLAQQIEKLNEINPQVASRLITPLIQFKSYAQSNQKLMREQLLILQALPNLSNDVKEKLDAALA